MFAWSIYLISPLDKAYNVRRKFCSFPQRNSLHAGFCHFTRVRVNKHIPPFTGGGFLTLSPSPDFICCVSNCKGNASLPPPRLASNGSIPLRSTTNYLALHGFILQNPHRYSRLSMQWLGMTLQRAAVNQSSRVSMLH